MFRGSRGAGMRRDFLKQKIQGILSMSHAWKLKYYSPPYLVFTHSCPPDTSQCPWPLT